DHHRQLIGPHAIGPFEHEVANLVLDILALAPRTAVIKADGAWRYAQSPGTWLPAGRQTVTASTGIGKFAVAANGGPGLLRDRVGNLFAGTGATVDQPPIGECIEGGLIFHVAAGLVPGWSVGNHAQRMQLLQNYLVGTVDAARTIDIFDAHQPGAPVGAGV